VQYQNQFYGLSANGDLFQVELSLNSARLSLIARDVEQLISNNNQVYVASNNQLVKIQHWKNGNTTNAFNLPPKAQNIFLDQQQNVWLMSDFDLQVLWYQPFQLLPSQAATTRNFDLVNNNFALNNDNLYQKVNNDWRLRTRLPVANGSEQLFITRSSIWFKQPTRLISVDKNSFVLNTEISLSPQDVVLAHSDNNLLIARNDRLISINSNGVQNVLRQQCEPSCSPDYKVNHHVVDGQNIWLATNRGLHVFNSDNYSFSNARIDNKIALAPLVKVFNADADHLWLIYPNKIAFFNKQSQTSRMYYSGNNRLLDASFSADKKLSVSGQQGWFTIANQGANSGFSSQFNLHQIEPELGTFSFIAPNELLELSQTEEELRLLFNLTKQHPEQSVYFRFKYQDEVEWTLSSTLRQSVTLKNLRQGHNQIQLQARVEGGDWGDTRLFVYDMPYEYLQTKWVVTFGSLILLFALFIFAIERIKRFRIVFDTMKQQSFITSLLESTKDGVWVANKDREIQSINVAFEEISGFSLEDVQGKSFQITSEKGRNHEVESLIWQEVIKSGFWTGEIWSMDKRGEPISLDLSVTRVETSNKFGSRKDVKYVGVFSNVTLRKQSEKTLRNLATRDPLTELANRTLFIELVERAINTANPHNPDFAVLFVDLDNFNKVNANLGPLQGDELLKQVAQALKEDLDKGISLARMAGDEFALLIPNFLFIGEPEFYIRKIAQQIKRKLAPSFMLSDTEVNINASIGVALYPMHGTNAETLMRCADTALKRVKQAGKNNFCIYETAIDTYETEILSLESELVRAFDNDEFVVHFQPKYLIKQNSICGFEALVRWYNPNRGEVLPDQFIPLAEENGLIRQLDKAVIKKVCAHIQNWQQQGFDFGHVAINISALNFQQFEFCQSIKKIVELYKVDPKFIELEITESAMMDDPEQTLRNLKELRSIGFSVALDDFGTGYSSLGHLKNFPIDRIKIDKSFVQDIEFSEQDKNIISVIIQLAKYLDIKVVAEGVESGDQAYILHILGCNEIQGYMISKALPADDIDGFMQEYEGKIASLSQ